MKSILLLVSLFVGLISHNALAADASAILIKIDNNTYAESTVVISSMIVHGERIKRTIKSKSWSIGHTKSFTEFLSPAREKGVKMLKLTGDLWTYYPQADRIVKIAGHMLRQSVMGSDMSYEDMMEERKLSEMYSAIIKKEETHQNRKQIILELTARQKNVAYFKRKLWVDKERFAVMKEELFAKSGKKLKKIDVLKIKKIKDRWYPTHLIYKDVLKKGEGTEIVIHNIEFNQKIPNSRFSKGILRR